MRDIALTEVWLRDLLAEARLGGSGVTSGRAILPVARLMEQRASGAGKPHPLGAMPTSIGRAADATIPVASPKVSRRHAEIGWDGERYLLSDCGSKNGTFLNGCPVRDAARLCSGDVIVLADDPALTFVFEQREDTLTVTVDRGRGGR
jgi:pSer/pThr/pTyr-binding forkhead associated (FHA) protein